MGPSDLDLAFLHAKRVVAADGGANLAHALGLGVEAIIGDMDSISPQVAASADPARFHHIHEQDSTDFEKCLARIDAPFILATGFTSGRIDHTLAVMSALTQHDGPPVIVLAAKDAVFAAPPELRLDLAIGTRLSLFPMRPVSGRSTGLKWPIDGLTLDPSGTIGTSNETTGPVTLTFDAPGCLVITPREGLEPALRALTGSARAPEK